MQASQTITTAGFTLVRRNHAHVRILTLIIFISGIIFYLSMELEWNQVHYCCRHLLAYCISPRWEMAIIVEQLVEWSSDRRYRSTRRWTFPCAALHSTEHTWRDPGTNPGHKDGKPATNRLSYGTGRMTGSSGSCYVAVYICPSDVTYGFGYSNFLFEGICSYCWIHFILLGGIPSFCSLWLYVTFRTLQFLKSFPLPPCRHNNPSITYINFVVSSNIWYVYDMWKVMNIFQPKALLCCFHRHCLNCRHAFKKANGLNGRWCCVCVGGEVGLRT
jgi:hypothetical protein